jgi:hypothetical protein
MIIVLLMILPREHSGKRSRNLENVGRRWLVAHPTGRFSRLWIDLLGPPSWVRRLRSQRRTDQRGIGKEWPIKPQRLSRFLAAHENFQQNSAKNDPSVAALETTASKRPFTFNRSSAQTKSPHEHRLRSARTPLLIKPARECLLMALSRHPTLGRQCLLSGAKRTNTQARMRAQKQKRMVDPITSAIITVSHKGMARFPLTNLVNEFQMTSFTLPRCATDHKLDTQRYRGRVIAQIATLLERAA